MSEAAIGTLEGARAESFLLACIDTLNLIGELDPPDYDAFDRWRSVWDSDALSTWISSARDEGIKLGPGLVSVWLYSVVQTWHKTGRQAADWLESVYDAEFEADGSLPEKLLRHLFKAMSEAGTIDLNDGLPTELYSGEGIIELSEVLLDNGYADLAKSVANGAARLLERVDSLGVRALRLAARAAFAAGQPEDAALKLGVLAVHPAVDRLDRFDALETCLRWIALDARGKAIVGFIASQMQKDTQAATLELYLKGLVRQIDPARVGYGDAERIRPIFVQGGIDDFVEALKSVFGELTAIERSRLELMPPIPDRALSTEWSTFSFRHRAFERSVPIGDALRRTTRGEEIALLVHHETTHVYSMMGAVGWALLAIRAAVLECEIYLGAGERLARRDRDPLGLEAAPPVESLTPLSNHGPATLLDVERQLDLIRKSQIIIDIWRPWFEGVAVLSELCDDSTGENVFSPSMSVLYNLFDLGAFSDSVPTPDTAEALVAAHMEAADAYYLAAAEGIGRYRLRYYLNDVGNRMHYLPGYLAVRRVVAAWRAAVDQAGGGSLSGAAITRLLLHVTRFASEKTVPEPDLPIEAFERAGRTLFADWMRSLTRISAADLIRAGTAYQRFDGSFEAIRWVDGRLVEAPDRAGGMETATFNRIATAAAGSMVATNNDPARVADADPECLSAIRSAAARAFELSKDRSWQGKVWTQVMHPYSILEIAETECPFWLLADQASLVIVLRTHESDVRTGRSAYRWLSVGIDRAQWDRLADSVRRHGSGRMRVRRVADLSDGEAGDEAGAGRQYLVLDYADWRMIFSMGLRFSADFASAQVEGDIAARLAPGILSQLDQRELAAGRGPAERARKWIDGAPNWQTGGVALAPWALHVRRLADDILRPEAERGTADWANAMLLEFALDDAGLAARVAKDGLVALLPGEDPGLLTAFVEFLGSSARSPTAELPAGLDELIYATRRSAGWDFDPLARTQGGMA